MRARVVLASTVFDTYFAGRLSALSAMAASPAVVRSDYEAVRAYLVRVQSRRPKLFTGGIGWLDREGVIRVSSEEARPPAVTYADRSYFRAVISGGQHFVSEGLAGRLRTQRRLVVMAVPTRDARGRLTGVLSGAILLRPARSTQRTTDLGFAGLAVIDRRGRQLTRADLAPPGNRDLMARLRRTSEGVFANTRGLDGAGDRVVAFATSRVAGWKTVIDQPRSTVFGGARRSLIIELIAAAVATATVLGLIGWASRRSRRDAESELARIEGWNELTSTLGAASEARVVSEALASALATAFPDALAIVTHERVSERDLAVTTRSGASLAGKLDAADERAVAEVAEFAYQSGHALSLDSEARVFDEFPDLQATLSGRAHALYAAPLVSRLGLRVGALALLFGEKRRLNESDLAVIAAHVAQAADALSRTRLQELEHDVATSLQRSLLPAALPAVEGLDVASRYRAAGAGLEVGGDWYALVERPDGIVHLTVGDVAGRGIPAAALMGQLRHAGRAYSYEHDAPAAICRSLLRHVPDNGMATVVCVTIDPYTRELAYSSAGHPPALLYDEDAGTVSRLDEAGAPPLGFAQPDSLVEAHVPLPGHVTVVMYTDGLVERRGASIDDGIDMVAGVLAGSADCTAERVAREILRASEATIGASDDIAILVVRLLEVPARVRVEIPARPEELRRLRKRLERWMDLRGLGSEERSWSVLAVHEACANAVEHAYEGTDGMIVVELHHSPESLTFAVHDRGRWRVPTPSGGRGRGIELIRAATDDVRIAHENGGTSLTATRRLRPGTATAPTPV
jgi:serine phosphatase RsbU (regulator of sigma subunit)/anti-sigma regulatory factor (Ser/Thr protein kinase)